MYCIDQEWDPLSVCVLGRTYPPEFYSWITVSKVRNMFEHIAYETEQIHQQITQVLEKFGVEVLRPNLPSFDLRSDGSYAPPPMHPRDHMMMLGNKFYYKDNYWNQYYSRIRDPHWGNYATFKEFLEKAPDNHYQEIQNNFNLDSELPYINQFDDLYGDIIQKVKLHGNNVYCRDWADGGTVTRYNNQLIFGSYADGIDRKQAYIDELPDYDIDILPTKGHSDGVFCAVCPGLIIAHDDPTTPINYEQTFPGWEVVRIPNHNAMLKKRNDMQQFLSCNAGRWWIPGVEHDAVMTNYIEEKFAAWTGNAIESMFDVNMLIIDSRNVMMCTSNDTIIQALSRHGITAHIMDVPHMYFWDGGIHCMTVDLDRKTHD
jgi:hypothetical protein